MPTPFEAAVRLALRAADRALEAGDDWLTAFDAAMTGQGCGYTCAACRCVDAAEDGHEPWCGWSMVAGGLG